MRSIYSISPSREMNQQSINYHVSQAEQILMYYNIEEENMKVALYGDSYIKRLRLFSQNEMKLPCDVAFFSVEGMTVDRYDEKLLQNMLRSKPDVVVLTLRGKDINSRSNPKEISSKLEELGDLILSTGVKRVFITLITERGQLKKDPLLTKRSFNAQRRKVNKLLQRTKIGQINMNNVRFPKDYVIDYAIDKVHLNDTGHRKMFFNIRRVLLSIKL